MELGLQGAFDEEQRHAARITALLRYLLASVYTIVALFALVQQARVIRGRHKLSSFSSGFFAASFAWAFLRSIYFFFTQTSSWSLWLRSLVWWLPIDLQFTAFSMLVLYFAKLHHRNAWIDRGVRWRMFAVFWAVNLTILAATITYAVLVHQYGAAQVLSQTSGLIAASAFLLLSVQLAYYCYRLRARASDASNAYESRELSRLTRLTIVMLTLFLTRFAYDILTVIGVGVRSMSHLDAPMFIALLCWEVLPTMLVLGYFRRIPTAARPSAPNSILTRAAHGFRTAYHRQRRSARADPASKPLLDSHYTNVDDDDDATPSSLLPVSPAYFNNQALYPSSAVLPSRSF